MKSMPFLRSWWWCLVLWGPAVAGLPAADNPAGRVPVIEHEPVKLAVRGQPLTLLARSRVEAGKIERLTLYYTQSRHGAPLKLPMQHTGMDMYTVTIPEDFIVGVSNLYYYIEAVSTEDEWAETKYYTVTVQDSGKKGAPAAKRKNWTTAALIAGGAAGVVGAAVAISDSGGGGGGGGTRPRDLAGTYVGTEFIQFTPEGGTTSGTGLGITVVIDGDGNVSSDNLAGGNPASGKVQGDRFIISVPAETFNADHDGNVTFDATVRNNTMSGNISGNVTTPTGNGVYSGTFTATKTSN
jgi:hypothetical protein